MNVCNYFIPTVYANNTLYIGSIVPNPSTVPFPQIDYTSVYFDDNHDNTNKKQICEEEEAKEKNCKSKTKKSRKLFTKEEDEKIKELTKKYGTKQWNLIDKFVEGRTPKQCRDRYCNHLFPGIFNGEWSIEEDELLLKLQDRCGPKWTVLQRSFQYRSTIAIKNRWGFFLCRRNDKDNKNKRELSSYNLKSNHVINEIENNEKHTKDYEIKTNNLDKKSINNSFVSQEEDYLSIFENIFNDKSFDFVQRSPFFIDFN